MPGSATGYLQLRLQLLSWAIWCIMDRKNLLPALRPVHEKDWASDGRHTFVMLDTCSLGGILYRGNGW
jgi:hypothetical protein